MTTVFISHASEDKSAVARPLANKLSPYFDVWLDENRIILGESIPSEIGTALKSSQLGIVILSKSFFQKSWTTAEVDALLSGENAKLTKIFPIWHKVTYEDVYSFNPLLASKLSVNTDEGIDFVANKVIEAVLGPPKYPRHHPEISTKNMPLDMGRTLNRSEGEIYLETGLSKDIEIMEKRVCTIGLLDVDGLTQINNRFGVEVGNKILSRIGRVLSREVAIDFPVGRCGDDTFFVVFWGLGHNKAQQHCKKLLLKISGVDWKRLAGSLHVSCSLGFATRRFDEPARDAVIRAAQAMLLAKAKGRGLIEEASEYLPREASRDYRSYFS